MEVISINISASKGTTKQPVQEAVIDGQGIIGDAHAGVHLRQVSLLAEESIARFSREIGRSFTPGQFAENITTRGLDLNTIAPLDRLRIGAVELEVTRIGKPCHGDGCAVFKEVGRCVMPKEGVFCRVKQGGRITPKMPIIRMDKILRFFIITLSDRASQGDYEDRSGPRIQALLEQYLNDRKWHPKIERKLLPDDPPQLANALTTACEEGVDVIITTGGTGVGPRDMTPEVVTPLLDKSIPGIMEWIRVKYGRDNPKALLSRSVAGIKEKTLIYALPGSVRAVEEYMPDILSTMEHLILTCNGIDDH